MSRQTRMKPIPISAAKHIANAYGYDQVVIYARRVGENHEGGEHMTTYGANPTHCRIAAAMGQTLKNFMGWNT